MSFPWLTVLMAVPLVGAAVVAFLPKRGDGTLAKQVALGVSLVALAIAAVIGFGYDVNGGYQYTEEHEWIAVFGAHYPAMTLVEVADLLEDGALVEASLAEGGALGRVGDLQAVDDEPLALKQVCTFIEQTPFLKLVGSYDSAVEALKARLVYLTGRASNNPWPSI